MYPSYFAFCFSTDQTARKKWTALRDYFKKAHKQLTTVKSGAPAEKKKKWYLYDNMMFLLPHMSDRKTCSNLSDPDTDDDKMSQISDVSIPLSDVSIQGPSTSFQQDIISQAECSASEQAEAATRPATTMNACRKRKAKFPTSHKDSLDSDILQAIKSMGETPAQATPEPDEDSHFFQSLVPKMKILDPLAKMECQTEIQMLVLKYVRRALAPRPPSQTEHYGNSHRGQYEGYTQSQSRSDEDPYYSGISNQYQTYSQQ